MGEAKRRKALDPDYGKTSKIIHKSSTLETNYGTNLVNRDNLIQALEMMKEQGHNINIVLLSDADDNDGDDLEFDEDGECVGDDTWDYPGSPYLSDDDDIY